MKEDIGNLPAFFFIICLCSGFILAASGASAQEAEEGGLGARLELSYVAASGNTDTRTLAGRFEAKDEGPVNRRYLSGSVLMAEGDGRQTSNKFLAEGRLERTAGRRLFGFLTAGYLRDKFSGYEYRAYGGPGLGYDILKTPRIRLRGLLSVLYNREEFSEGGLDADDYATGKAQCKLEWDALENLGFKQSAAYFASFEDLNRYFVDSESAFEIKVNAYISLGVSYIVNYQNEPPSMDVEHTDTTFLTTVIVDI